MIGAKSYLGTQFRGLSAGKTSVTCPNQNHKRWMFWNGLKWQTDSKSSIHLFCTEDFSKHVAVDCLWSKWGTWSTCSKSCGNGFSIRKRTKSTTPKNGGKECIGQSKSK